jgi:hypothetical protein
MLAENTTIPGLVLTVQVEEVNHIDPDGRLICYLDSLYKINTKTSVRSLLKRSRIPGAADDMKREFERDGIEALRRYAPCA